MIKLCTKCNEKKLISLFCKDASKKDGYSIHCKQCDNIKQKRYYIRNRKEIIERKKRAGIFSRNKEKVRIRAKTRYAVKVGKLIKTKCEKCGTNNKIEAHHKDYSKPLEVMWLCRKCHFKIHGMECYG